MSDFAYVPGWSSCYLAGPMRGIPHFNFPAFDEAAEKLRAGGWLVFSPAEKDKKYLDTSKCPIGSDAELDAQGFSFQGALAWDFTKIMEADCVIALPGWEKSTGVHWEMTVAHAVGKPVFSYPDLTPVDLPFVVTNPTACGVLFDQDVPVIQMPTREELDDLVPSGQETRVVDPSTGGEKGSKLARFDLLPWDVLNEIAEHYGKGSRKYEDRNWQKGYAWSLSIAALGRHLSAWLAGEDTDPETGTSHIIAVAWHAMALRWFQLHGRGTDDRWRGNVA